LGEGRRELTLTRALSQNWERVEETELTLTRALSQNWERGE